MDTLSRPTPVQLVQKAVALGKDYSGFSSYWQNKHNSDKIVEGMQ